MTRAARVVRLAAALALSAALGACGSPGTVGPIDGVWRLDPSRTQYGPNVRARVAESFDCRTTGRSLRCDIVSVFAPADTVRAHFIAIPGGGTGTVTGIASVDGVRLEPRAGGYDAVFEKAGVPILGYRITGHGDSLVVQTTDPRTGETMDTRVVYTRAP